MHELSLAYNIVQIAAEAAEQAGITQIRAVHLRLGAMAAVDQESLLFGFEIAVQETRLAGARLEIEALPLVIYCPKCQMERTLDTIQLLCCPVCGTPSMDIRQGKELDIAYLEVDHEPAHS